jgi:hypothetical protein
MKRRLTATILTTTIFAATMLLTQADDRTVLEKVRDGADKAAEKTREAALDTKDAVVGAAHDVRRATRRAWNKTKAFFSDDMPVYHEGASAILADLARDIADLKARTASSAPGYYRTRLLALDEQHEHLTRHLLLLTNDDIKDRSAVPRHDFDRCLADLERALDQAESGADALPRIALK